MRVTNFPAYKFFANGAETQINQVETTKVLEHGLIPPRSDWDARYQTDELRQGAHLLSRLNSLLYAFRGVTMTPDTAFPLMEVIIPVKGAPTVNKHDAKVDWHYKVLQVELSTEDRYGLKSPAVIKRTFRVAPASSYGKKGNWAQRYNQNIAIYALEYQEGVRDLNDLEVSCKSWVSEARADSRKLIKERTLAVTGIYIDAFAAGLDSKSASKEKVASDLKKQLRRSMDGSWGSRGTGCYGRLNQRDGIAHALPHWWPADDAEKIAYEAMVNETDAKVYADCQCEFWLATVDAFKDCLVTYKDMSWSSLPAVWQKSFSPEVREQAHKAHLDGQAASQAVYWRDRMEAGHGDTPLVSRIKEWLNEAQSMHDWAACKVYATILADDLGEHRLSRSVTARRERHNYTPLS